MVWKRSRVLEWVRRPTIGGRGGGGGEPTIGDRERGGGTPIGERGRRWITIGGRRVGWRWIYNEEDYERWKRSTIGERGEDGERACDCRERCTIGERGKGD